MNPDHNHWEPSRRQTAFDWYLGRAMRILGGGMIVWELALDQGHNPLVLLLGAMLATTKDAVEVVKGLVYQARAEREDLNNLLEEAEREETKRKEDSDAAMR